MPGRPNKGAWARDWAPNPAPRHEDFAAGNEVAVTHGSYSAARREPVAEALKADLAQVAPRYLDDGSFRWSIDAWAKAEAMLVLFETWMDGLSDKQKFTATGAQAPAVATWNRLADGAARARARLGLDPASRVKIGQALAATGVDLASLAAKMAEAEDWDGVPT
jgi:hypothetical protein